MPSSRGLALFWASRDIATLGNGILLVALLAWSYQVQEAATVVSIVLVAWLLPSFLLAPLAERLVRGPRAYPIALLSYVATIAALVPLLRVASFRDLSLLITIALLVAIPAPFIKASRQVMARALAGDRDLRSGTGSMLFTRLLALISAPAIATILYSGTYRPVSGITACIAAALVALALSALLLLLARPSRWDADPSPTGSIRGDLAQLQDGLLLVWRSPSLRATAVAFLAFTLITGGLVVLQVALMIWGAFTSAENVGMLLAAQAFGFALAATGGRVITRRNAANTVVALGLGLLASGIFGLPISDSTERAAACGLVIGFGFGLLGPSFATMIRSFAEPGEGGVAAAGLGVAADAAVLLSAIVMGPLTDLLSTRFAAVFVAILAAILALYSFGSLPEAGANKPGDQSPLEEPEALYDMAAGIPAMRTLG